MLQSVTPVTNWVHYSKFFKNVKYSPKNTGNTEHNALFLRNLLCQPLCNYSRKKRSIPLFSCHIGYIGFPFHQNYVTDNEISKKICYVTLSGSENWFSPPYHPQKKPSRSVFLPPETFFGKGFDTGTILCYSSSEYEGNDEDMPRKTPPREEPVC